MKSLKVFLIAIICVSVTSCITGQEHKSVRGNGNVVKKERPASPFTGIRVKTGIDVYLKQGDKESITVEADENLHEYILTEIQGDILNIYTDVWIREADRKRVYVTMKDVKSIKTSSAGDIMGETPLKCEDLEIGTSSAGNIRLEIYGKKIDVNVSSAGDVTLSGEGESLYADLSSAGNLDAANLKVKEAEVSASSAGDARVNVSEKIKARASSAGDITYRGDPKYVDAHSSSAGSIHKR
jgi:uncharacterized protein YxeA